MPRAISKRYTLIKLAIPVILVLAALVLKTPLLAPVQDRLWGWWVTTTARFTGLGPLSVEPTVLEQLRRLTLENIQLKAEQQELRSLKKQLGSASISDATLISGQASRSADSVITELIIDRGAADGLTLTTPVIIEGNILVGFIVNVYDHTSVARLLIASRDRIEGVVVGSELARGLVHGNHLTSLLFDTVPRDANISAGQAVVTLANAVVPGGLLLGTVTDVRSQENEPYQSAQLTLPYDPGQIRAVTMMILP